MKLNNAWPFQIIDHIMHIQPNTLIILIIQQTLFSLPLLTFCMDLDAIILYYVIEKFILTSEFIRRIIFNSK